MVLFKPRRFARTYQYWKVYYNRKEDISMSGHSKFANIKHKKEKNDAAKGKTFTMIGREIAIAVKEGGPDPANNSKLRM